MVSVVSSPRTSQIQMSETRDNSNSCFLMSHSKLPLTHLQGCTALLFPHPRINPISRAPFILLPRLACDVFEHFLVSLSFTLFFHWSPAQPFLPLSQLDSLLLLLYFIKGLYLFIYLKFKMTKLIKLWIWNTCKFQIQCIHYAKRKFGLASLCKAETTFQI